MKDNSKNFVKDVKFSISSIETIDAAVFDWVDNKLNLSSTTNTGFQKVPVIWVSAERAYIVKKEKETRDKSGAMNYPLISIERVSINKDLAKKGSIWGNVPPVNDEKGGSIVIARKVNQDKTSNFANADSNRIIGQINFPRKNKKVVYQTISIPMPVYIEVMYDIHIRTLYQQQMNELLQPFISKTGSLNYLILSYEEHRYEAFIQSDFKNESNVKTMGTEERKFMSTVSVKVLGKLIGDGVNQEKPKLVYRENAVDIKIPRERIILGDSTEIKNSNGYVGVTSLEGTKK